MVFICNSLGRQVLQGIVCHAHALNLTDQINLKWSACPNSKYPCHGAVNCITCGEHSGYETTGPEILFKGGTRIYVVEPYQSRKEDFFSSNETIDFLFVQKDSKKGEGVSFFYRHRKKHNLTLPKLIAFNGWNSHFFNKEGLTQGVYNETFLKQQRLIVHNKSTCVDTLSPLQQLPINLASKLYNKWKPDAFFQLEGINSLGNAKIGHNVGAYGDCQHFCAPGPPDQLSYYLVQLFLQMSK